MLTGWHATFSSGWLQRKDAFDLLLPGLHGHLLNKVRLAMPLVQMRSLWGAACLVLALALSCLACPGNQNDVQGIDRGYRQMYNLDFAGAHDTFHAHQVKYPDDPLGYTSDAAAYLFAEFDRLHVLESDLFIDDQAFGSRNKLSPDPKVKQEFEQHLAKSDELVGKILARSQQDPDALFAQVLANGLRGDYAALIEKRNLASLGYMKRSRGIAQQLLTIEPACYDAYLAVGVENYLLGINSAPMRWVLRMTGAQTDKEEGLKRLQITAEKGQFLAPFARLLLAVAALRDKDPQAARNLLAGLAAEFPHNQLYAKELARIH